jgi:glycosyltransferase involved in cell wall biosynthesis
MTGLRIACVLASTAGGTGRHAAMLASGCAARGIAVGVFGPETVQNLLAGSAASYVRLDIADRPRPARDAAAVLRLRGLLAWWQPDVVHAHGLRAAAVTGLALAAAARRPALLVTVHNAAPEGLAPAAVYRALELLAARRADAVLCVSADLAARMRRAGARDVATAVVAAPEAAAPSAEAVSKARADIGAAGHKVVLGVGRLAPQKGFDVLVDAAASLRGRGGLAPVLAIAGEGPSENELRTRARVSGAHVRFLGARGDVPALLAAADVVAVPSRWDGQPLIVQEALRAGRPLVASRAGGIPALAGEDAALLVRPADPGRLAAAIASVLHDPELARRLGDAAAARAGELPSPADAVDAASAAYGRLAVRIAANDRATGRAGP